MSKKREEENFLTNLLAKKKVRTRLCRPSLSLSLTHTHTHAHTQREREREREREKREGNQQIPPNCPEV